MLLALPAFRGLGERWDRDRSALGNLLYGIGEQHLEELLQEMQKMLEESFDKERNLKLFRVQAQINALQSQINPHFLYNALEVMRSYAYTAGANQVAEMAEALSTMFRYSVGKADDVCTVEEEMDSINNYFLIQHYRYNDRFSLKLLYDPKEDELMKCQIPRLSVQPIIENAVHHGLERKLGKGTVSIRIFAAWDRLIIRVLDDGVGIPADQVTELNRVFSLGLAYKAPAPEARKEESTHIALININQRIKLYFGEEYGLSISSALGAGTLVELNLPRKYQPLSRETGTDEADYFTGFPTIQTTSSNHDSGSALL
ncbi:sensor histidine kinase [Hominifimenecus sp. rT4P-3]|uniref:sensor histidine kinase n=1 Tax=Hominifimenecus sp. rT4P-3 TaxID=3242979 RepID=UPI003DA669ED